MEAFEKIKIKIEDPMLRNKMYNVKMDNKKMVGGRPYTKEEENRVNQVLEDLNDYCEKVVRPPIARREGRPQPPRWVWANEEGAYKNTLISHRGEVNEIKQYLNESEALEIIKAKPQKHGEHDKHEKPKGGPAALFFV